MSNKHKYPTISFRVTDYERKEIEARILTSGMSKKDYFIRSCIYNHICVVGKSENIYPLVQELQSIYENLSNLYESLFTNIDDNSADKNNSPDLTVTSMHFPSLQHEYISMLKAIIELLDGAKYLWE